MTYKSIAAMAQDTFLIQRIMACATDVDVPDALNWTRAKIWLLVSFTSDWMDAWDIAVSSGVVNPGNDETVITDAMILATVMGITW